MIHNFTDSELLTRYSATCDLSSRLYDVAKGYADSDEFTAEQADEEMAHADALVDLYVEKMRRRGLC